MMSPLSAPLHLKPQFSKRLALFVGAIHLSALIIVSLLPLSWAIQLSLGALIILSGIHGISYQAQRHPLYGCVLHHDTVRLSSGESARIAAQSYVHPQLVILRVILETGRTESL
ncbi:MAG: hypothetical protein SVR94_16200, partial [Pseudomonadota bacterium]|nr:hypothetical protein [Pseudomonadota bacterium]